MINEIKAAPLSVKIAMGILGLLFLVLIYVAPVAVILISTGIWAIQKVINYFIDLELK